MQRSPSLLLSLTPVIILIALLSFNVFVFHDDSSYGPNQLALLISGVITSAIAYFVCKMPYNELEKSAISSITVALQAMFILLIVGSLIGVWILNGTVPAMIYYGVKMIHPAIFLPVCLIICAIVSLATGSSWSTVGTVGIALVGIGTALEIPLGMVGGAIVSGSYFGDKMSPLSDTTNLAPAMAGTDLFTHIKHMLYTSGPAFIISLILFSILGFVNSAGQADLNSVDEILTILDSKFNITLWLFTLPILVVVLIKLKVSALPVLFLGTIIGAVYGIIFQGELISSMMSEGQNTFVGYYQLILATAFDGFSIESGNKMIDKLLNRGGMSGMLNTVWLIISAMFFGGMLEASGMLQKIAETILKAVKGTASLVASTIGTTLFFNITTSDQYIAIVMSGRMYKQAYQDLNLHPKNLSRAVEDGATVTSVLVPWNTCGAYFSSVLGMSTFTYLPFAFFNLLSPVISIFLAMNDWTMEKIDEQKSA